MAAAAWRRAWRRRSRWGGWEPEDVGLDALLLAFDRASWLIGVTLDMAGGYVMT
jgi:hypothetical protein